jgi:hypothetical protein
VDKLQWAIGMDNFSPSAFHHTYVYVCTMGLLVQSEPSFSSLSSIVECQAQ